ncbi:rRNA maturation RNase YbeY [Candidatus Gracilibacteria bacterium]|nr:rRNA maturation RNase YbeY [Candidatus Gracilibacteria bacterium]
MKLNIFFNIEEKFSNEIKNNFSDKDFQKIFFEIQKNIPKSKKNFSEKSDFFDEKEVNLFFVSDDEIQKLNKEFRGKDSATDCLSFEKSDEDKNDEFDPVFGECFIAMPYIQHQAEEYGVSLKFEITKMMIHSILHLYGFDHIDDADFEEMNALENEIMESVKNEIKI